MTLGLFLQLQRSPSSPFAAKCDSCDMPTDDEETNGVINHIRPSSQRQSSLSHSRLNGTPRTTNRVRFDLDDRAGSPQPEEWVDDDDYLTSPSQRAPLLTNVKPPSSSPFLSESFQPEDYLPDARPKNGMRSAFMNMANSIIGAGIIGQTYAFRQAGMTMGIILLITLTGTGAPGSHSALGLTPDGKKNTDTAKGSSARNLLAARRLPPVVVNNQKPATPAREHQPEMKS
ncbi:uncharacterized protein Z519_04991 [Cladophialophora bantiana CBS 173.52]|uniref:Amino acid transporter transmembrane domain-containing protein n=1 Tax=Cladophialophora bantiana (strain ATCC 10958 / CBS 173.52 / CDC B-1940 / NIH 8579) TaxID=1442370 RepID=A0A0D2EYI6_CLAB1|nr:uncharacterized protein Z519_04991 [Cladophialophora bantiana CBS 173.52]KIW95011.1 hypothetical protein Z519_04991 [Cladophialophora bantiana CBS 173.52]